MVAGILSLWISFQIIHQCVAVSCFDLRINDDGYLVKKDTCDGDLCVYYQPGPTSKFMEQKSCATGFKLPLGCLNDTSDNSVMCICNSDFCNDGRVEEATITPKYTCHSDVRQPNTTTTGSTCMMSSGVDVMTYKSDDYVGVKDSDVYPLPLEDPEITGFFFYPGLVHTSMMKKGLFRAHSYKCKENLCNSITLSALPVIKNVSCFGNEMSVPESTDCKGEFCVFAIDPFRELSSRFCLSTFNLHSENQYERGVYKYRRTTYYLCQEDGCNYNETIAAAATEKIPEKIEEPVVIVYYLDNIKPEYLFAALSFLSATMFISITVIVIRYEILRFEFD